MELIGSINNNKLDFSLLDRYARRIRSTGGYTYRWTFTDENGTRTTLSGNTRRGFSVWQTPLFVFYQIFMEFHPNGYLSRKGKIMGNGGVRVGEWRHYDETGQLIKTVDEDAKFGKFGYNELLLLLHKRGHINIETGAGREGLDISFNSENKTWGVITETNFWITIYDIDGQTGDILEMEEKQGGIM